MAKKKQKIENVEETITLTEAVAEMTAVAQAETPVEVVEAIVEKRRGRPVVEGSARQQKLAAIAAKIEAGQTISRGRPANPQSNRQARLAAQAARLAAGLEIKLGRPKGSGKKETVVEATIEAPVETAVETAEAVVS